MTLNSAAAIACSNIAFIKYWGNSDHRLRLAANASLSMNLAALTVQAAVEFIPTLAEDQLSINSAAPSPAAAQRVFEHLDLVRSRARISTRAKIATTSNFPAGAGIASSAAAFAALSVAGAAAAGLTLSQAELSALARRGSGSASRSVPGGFCQWLADGNQREFATSIAPADHWDLCDVVAVVSVEHKRVGSTGGHELADSSDLQAARVAGAAERFAACKQALLNKDLSALGPIIEEDAILMHSVMMTCRPPIFYWLPATLEILHAVPRWRAGGLPVYFTIDAGPNVHLICESRNASQVEAAARALPGVQKTFRSGVGGPTRLVNTGN